MTTPDLKLLIGPKNRSSWSMRAWLILTHFGIPFAEDNVDYNKPQGYRRLKEISPSSWVPVLWNGELAVWDTLAIAEHLAEIFPEHELWPTDVSARARARSVTAEMHSGFGGIRNEMHMVITATGLFVAPGRECRDDILRIQHIWNKCRTEFGEGGPFLFGKFSIADAFYAPVVARFRTYGIKCDGAAADYAEAIWALPAMQAWLKGAEAEVRDGIG